MPADQMADKPSPVAFQHSSLGISITLSWCLGCFLVDSYQSIIDKFDAVKRWWWFSGVLGYFAWLYVRPYVRIGLDSASRGHLFNFTTCYMAWLCGAVFYHLPRLEAMGFEIRADLSVFIVVLLSTLSALTCLLGLHTVAVRMGLVKPKVSSVPGARIKEVVGILLLNSVNLALACSSYHSVCGNGLMAGSQSDTAAAGSGGKGNTGGAAGRALRAAICAKWLHPIPTAKYPNLASWMLYGEGANSLSFNNTSGISSGNSTSPVAWIAIDIPLDGQGSVPVPAASVLSPVLTLWCTVMLIYIANSMADHAAADTLHAAHMGELRREVVGGSSIWKRQRSLRERRDTRDRDPRDPHDPRDAPGPSSGPSSASGVAIAGPSSSVALAALTTALNGGGGRVKPPRPRGPLEVKKTIQKASSSPSLVAASAAALGRRVLRSTPMQTLVRDTEWLGHQAAGFLDRTLGGSTWGSTWGRAYRSLSMHGGGGGPHGSMGAWGGGADAANGLGRLRLFQPSFSGWVGHVMGGQAMMGGAAGAEGMAGVGGAGGMEGPPLKEGEEEAQPEFLPMVPWYSGTSADLLKMSLDLIVSFKLFLGRFDMRTMQSATGASMSDSHNAHNTPSEGDGFTYEQYDSRDELWMDFIADTGDGGNSTYCVARALAATSLAISVPPQLATALPTTASADPPAPAAARAGGPASTGATWAANAGAAGAGNTGATGVVAQGEGGRDELGQLGGGLNGTHVRQGGVNGVQAKSPGGQAVEGGAAAKKGGAGGGGRGAGSSSGSGTAGVAAGAAAGAGTAGTPARDTRLVLPRAELLLLGGDLAYPNPTKETYEQRLLRPFQDALPPPPHHHPERLVVHKPDLPPMWGVQEAMLPGELRGLSPRASRHASSGALRSYPGPACFAIPGNHDWIDGLETFINYILHKGWLGGWLLPQEKSYFSLKLPHGWWLFGLDLGLNEDIDMCQLRYFANVVEQRLAPDDNVVIMTHQPMWLIEWFWHKHAAPSMRQLIRGHLRGRARVHLAGDLHFYMRHSFIPPPRPQAPDNTGAPPPPATQQPTAPTAKPPPQTQPAHPAQPAVQGKRSVAGQAPAVQPSKAQVATPAVLTVPVVGQAPALNLTPGSTSLPISMPLPISNARSTSLPISNAGSASSPTQQAAGVLSTPHIPIPSAGLNGPQTASGVASSPQSGSVLASSPGMPITGASTGLHGPQQATGYTSSPAHQPTPSILAGSSPASRPTTGLLAGSSPVPVPGQGGAWGGVRVGGPSSVVGGSSDDESEGGMSVSSRSSRRRPPRDRSVNKAGLRSLGRHLPAICVQDLGLMSGPQANLGLLSGQQQAQAMGLGISGSAPTLMINAGHVLCEGCLARARELRHHTFDPEHLICNGAGGAFLHPSHVFAPAAFAPPPDPAAEATAALYSAAQLPCTCQVHQYDAREAWGAGPAGFNSGWEVHAAHAAPQPPQTTTAGGRAGGGAGGSGGVRAGGAAGGGAAGGGLPAVAQARGHYKCHVSYPSPERSLELGRKNLHVFRLQNTRFDIIGGGLYFLLVISIMPRCSRPGPIGSTLLTLNDPTTPTTSTTTTTTTTTTTLGAAGATTTTTTAVGAGAGAGLVGGVAAILDADTAVQMVLAATAAYLDALCSIFTDSYISLAVVLMMFVMCVGLAKSGGVGTIREDPGGGARPSDVPQKGLFFSTASLPQPSLRLRSGGFGSQLLWGLCHTLAHLSVALVLLLMLELGVEMCIRHEQLGKDGLHSLFRWYEQYETEHFPDPQGVRRLLKKVSLGLYPGLIKAVMAVFDLPEVVAVTRTAVCSAGGSMAALSRLQVLGFYGGMLAYFWVLATPAVGAVFGAYLYASVVWGGVHFDEAFASLRLPTYKSLTRLHITPEGDLEIYSVATDRVPSSWREDPRWRGTQGGGNPALPAHLARHPSRWLPPRHWAPPAAPAAPAAAAAGAAAAGSGEAGGGSGGVLLGGGVGAHTSRQTGAPWMGPPLEPHVGYHQPGNHGEHGDHVLRHMGSSGLGGGAGVGGGGGGGAGGGGLGGVGGGGVRQGGGGGHHAGMGEGDQAMDWKLIDYVKVPRIRAV